MTKILIDEAVVRQALEALEEFCEMQTMLHPAERRDALRQALEQPVAQIDTSAERVEKEAENKHMPTPPECKTEAEKTAFAFGWFKALESVREQPAPAQEPVAWMNPQEQNARKAFHWFESEEFTSAVYTTPPAPAQPLTQDMVESCPYDAETLRGAYFDGWLKAEAAHGIKGNT